MEYWVGVKYTDVSANATPPSLMQSKWMSGTKCSLAADNDFTATAMLDIARQPGDGPRAFLRVTVPGGQNSAVGGVLRF